MAQSITIDFQPRPDYPAVLEVDRYRNFAEELSLSLDRSDLGTLPMAQADAVSAQIRITGIKKRDVGRCLALLENLLEQHFLTDQAKMSVHPD